MRRLAHRYPDDPDVVTFFAESLLMLHRRQWWTKGGVPVGGTEEAVQALAEHICAYQLFLVKEGRLSQTYIQVVCALRFLTCRWLAIYASAA